MTLTLADIDVWDHEAIDEVFAAATARAEGAESTGDTVAELLSFVGWDGLAADAARDSAHRIKLALGDHGDRCRQVADAAKRAAAEVAGLKCRLSQIRADAAEAFIGIDNRTGALAPRTAVLAVDQLRRREAVMPELAGRIARLLADADSADRDLARAIGTAIDYADGDPGVAPPSPPPSPPPSTPPSPPPRDMPPAEPADVKKWWDALTPQQRMDRLAGDAAAIDRDGIPADIRDVANRIRLRHEISLAATALEAASRREVAYWEHVNTHHGEPPPDYAADPVAALARARARHDELLAIQKAISGRDRRRLILLDTESNPRHVLAAIGVGDVDRAARVGVTTGGVATGVTDLPRLVEEATELRDTTVDILARRGYPHPESVATITWVGYEPPANLADLRVLGDGVARAAAPRLNSFLEGLAVAGENPRQEITAFGHSYGSLVTSLALQQGSPVKNVVFYGSPGLELGHVGDLHLAAGGRAYYEQAPGDPIALTQLAPSVLDAIPLIGPALNWLFGSGDHHQRFGDTPNELPGFTQLSTTGGADPVLGENRAGARGHSQYQRDDGTSDHRLRMSGYNLAAVLSGSLSAPKTGK
jgi:hypothetical protein